MTAQTSVIYGTCHHIHDVEIRIGHEEDSFRYGIECRDSSGEGGCTGRDIDRTWTATDACGATKTCLQHIIFDDTTAPVVHCPNDMLVVATTVDGAVVTYTVTATDNCDPNPTIVCNPPSGGTFPKGTTTVDCTATDSCGKSAQCSFTVTVSDKPTAVFVDSGYAGKPNGTKVNYPNDGNPGSHTVGFDAFSTMQAGVDGTSAGGTLRVAAGTYPELVVVSSPMTINGANAGVDPRSTCNGGATRGPESIKGAGGWRSGRAAAVCWAGWPKGPPEPDAR